jgi:hypothetical protein
MIFADPGMMRLDVTPPEAMILVAGSYAFRDSVILRKGVNGPDAGLISSTMD